MLLVFAWSAVQFNLPEQVYKPVMKVFFEFEDPQSDLPKLDKPLEQPALGWREALRIGRELMAEQAVRHGFAMMHEQSLLLDRVHGVYRFSVHSDRYIANAPGSTTVFLDANSGRLKAFRLPTGQYAGNTVTAWLSALHQGEVFWPALPHLRLHHGVHDRYALGDRHRHLDQKTPLQRMFLPVLSGSLVKTVG